MLFVTKSFAQESQVHIYGKYYISYKKLVKKYHPDYNMGNKEYENKIKEINQAYNDIKDIK